MQNPNNNYRHIIEQIEDYAILLLDENGIILDWNKGAEKIKGYKAKEIIGKNFRVFYPEQDRENKLPEQLIAKAITHGSAMHEGFRVRKDGSLFWGSILITALFDKTDKLTGFLKITRDLTEKKELEEKLRKLNHGLEQQVKERTAELQKQFKEILDYKFAIDESSIVAITDLKGIIIHANDNFCKISKYTQAELIGQDHIIVNSGYHPKEFMRELWVTIANGKIWKGEIKNKAKDGTIYWVDTTIVPFLSEAGKPTRYIAIRADITLQKESEEKLIASEKQFRNVLENMMEGVQIIDFNWRYIYANDALSRYSYHTKEQLVGYTIMEKYPGVEQTELFKTLKQCMEERTAHQLETEFVFPDGSKKDFELRIQPVPEGIFILSLDITERKKAVKVEHELHSRLRAIFEKTTDAIMLADDNGNYVEVNPAAAKMLGYSQQELTGMNAAKIISRSLDEELWNEFIQDGSQTGAIELVRKDGSLIICHYNATSNILPGLHLSILTDITERKKAEQAIKESEARLAASQSVAKVGSWETDLTNLDVIWSDEARRIFGIDNGLSHTTHKNFLKFVHPEDKEKVDKAFAASFTSDSVNSIEHRIIAADGIIKEIEERWLIEIDENGKPIRALGTVQDITERKKAEEKLRISEKRTRKIFEAGMIGFIFWDANGEILDANDHFLEMTGYSRKDLQEKKIHWNKMTPPEFADLDRQGLEQITLTGICQPFEKEYIRKDGSRVPVLLGATGFEGNNPEKGVAYVMDITERISALEKIKQSEENYRFLFNNNPAVIFIWDLETLKIIEVNQSAEAVYGYTRKEFLNMSVLDTRAKEEHERLKTFAKQMLDKPTAIIRKNWQHKTKDGQTMMMDITAHYIIYKGRPSIFALGENITDKLLIEEELQNSYEDIRQLNAHLQTVREEERKRIGREIHDELGQQLTAIKMDTVWIDKQIPEEKQNVKNKLQNIIELLDGSHESVRKILNELRPTLLDENGLLDALQWQGQQFTESTGTPIHFTCNQNSIKLPQETATCIFRVYQESLTNIMRHAMATEIISSLNIINDSILLTIEDDGKGFDIKKTDSKKRFGILGMKERVFALNGKFELHSLPEKGTRIVITLPY